MYYTHRHRRELLMLNPIWLFLLLNLGYYYLKRVPLLLLDWVIRRYLATRETKKEKTKWTNYLLTDYNCYCSLLMLQNLLLGYRKIAWYKVIIIHSLVIFFFFIFFLIFYLVLCVCVHFFLVLLFAFICVSLLDKKSKNLIMKLMWVCYIYYVLCTAPFTTIFCLLNLWP